MTRRGCMPGHESAGLDAPAAEQIEQSQGFQPLRRKALAKCRPAIPRPHRSPAIRSPRRREPRRRKEFPWPSSPPFIPLQQLSHESSKMFNLGVPGDAMTFQTNFIAMLDHVGTHVDAFKHVNPNGKPVDEMPLDLFMGKAVCFDVRHVPDLGDITVKDMEEAEKKCGVRVNGHIVLLCTGFHARTYPTVDSVWKNPYLTVEATRWLHERGSRMHGVE